MAPGSAGMFLDPEPESRGCTIAGMTDAEHQIVGLVDDPRAGGARWWCRCGDVRDGYDDVAAAARGGARHQLPTSVRLELEDELDGATPERWADALVVEADAASEDDPTAWAWWRDARRPPGHDA